MSDATKDALTVRGFLVKKKIGQNWHYELETIVYRSFPPNAELFFVYQSNDTLLWSGGRDIVGFDAKLGLEALPETTIVNTWQFTKPVKIKQRVYKGGLPSLSNKGSQISIEKRNKGIEKIKAKKSKKVKAISILKVKKVK